MSVLMLRGDALVLAVHITIRENEAGYNQSRDQRGTSLRVITSWPGRLHEFDQRGGPHCLT